VAPLTIVEPFDEGEDRAARLLVGLEGLSIQQLALHSSHSKVAKNLSARAAS
jgi:hypothetical protein